MTTKIVEIPVPKEQENGSQARPSVDVNTFLSSNFSFLNNEDAQALNSMPSQAQIYRQSSASSLNSLDSASSWNLDEDFNSCVFLDNDDEFPSPFNSQIETFPESPSVEDLRNQLGNMRRPSLTGHKQEKEEDNEEESYSEHSSLSSDDELEEILKKGSVDDEYVPNNFNLDGLRAIKKTRLGVQKNDSFSSISSYSSEASSSEDNDDNEDDSEDFDEEDTLLEHESPSNSARKRVQANPKKYIQPTSLRADNLTIGAWSLQQLEEVEGEVTFDIKILFGRKKIKYELARPQRGPKHRLILAMDFPFNFISGLEFKAPERTIIFQLSERPSFTKKEKGRSTRTTDWTGGQASVAQRHHIVVNDTLGFTEYMERLLSADRRLRQLAKVGIPNSPERGFPVESTRYVPGGVPPCDWDKEVNATKHCEDCNQNFCDVCDDVLHRHEVQKTHRRIPVQLIMKPAPKPRKLSNKKRKKMNPDRCRCGTGATKGTLGEPCTGNRCPCFSNGKSCVNCGCKGCANPVKRNPRSPAFATINKQSILV
jgi:hypothetical protein